MLSAAISLSVLAACLGILLGVAARVFHVQTDDRTAEILAMMPGSQCGAVRLPGLRWRRRRARRRRSSGEPLSGRRTGARRSAGGEAGAAACRRLGAQPRAGRGRDSRGHLHRLHEVLPGLPDRRGRRRGQAAARRHARCLHRLRQMRRELPDRSDRPRSASRHPGHLGVAQADLGLGDTMASPVIPPIRLLLQRWGVHPDSHKHPASEVEIGTLPLPPQLILPLQQHAGAPARALVAVGDHVLCGQMIAAPGGRVSAPVHAPTSGPRRRDRPVAGSPSFRPFGGCDRDRAGRPRTGDRFRRRRGSVCAKPGRDREAGCRCRSRPAWAARLFRRR